MSQVSHRRPINHFLRVRETLFTGIAERTRETGLEPVTSAVTGQCSNQLNYSRKNDGRNRTRTYDHLCVRQALYQLSYTPLYKEKYTLHYGWIIGKGFAREGFSCARRSGPAKVTTILFCFFAKSSFWTAICTSCRVVARRWSRNF